MKAIRGATCADYNTQESIISATTELLLEIYKRNDLSLADSSSIVSIVFSCTQDLTKAYPAYAARQMGINTALFCVQEMHVDNSLPMCIRVLITIDSNKEMKHCYLKGAQELRRDLQ